MREEWIIFFMWRVFIRQRNRCLFSEWWLIKGFQSVDWHWFCSNLNFALLACWSKFKKEPNLCQLNWKPFMREEWIYYIFVLLPSWHYKHIFTAKLNKLPWKNMSVKKSLSFLWILNFNNQRGKITTTPVLYCNY